MRNYKIPYNLCGSTRDKILSVWPLLKRGEDKDGVFMRLQGYHKILFPHMTYNEVVAGGKIDMFEIYQDALINNEDSEFFGIIFEED